MRVRLIDLWGREGMLHYVSQLANSLARISGMKVRVLLPRDSDIDLFDKTVFVGTFEGRLSVPSAISPFQAGQAPWFFQNIRRTRPDVLHLNNCHVENNFEIHNYYIPDHHVSPFFKRASIVVLPYSQASQSGFIPLAYAFKKPVVTTHVGCLLDVVEDGQTDLIVPPRDAPALAENMLRFLRDENLRTRLGQNAYEKMKKELSWDRIASTTLNIYQAVI